VKSQENLHLSPARAPSALPSAIDKSLLAYAASATAAGVSLLALAQPANAKIVFTPSNIHIPENAGLIHLDLNHDGVADFAFSAGSRFGSARAPLGLYANSLVVTPEQPGNAVGEITSSKGFDCAAKLRRNVEVGPGKHFQTNQLIMFQVAGDYTNQFSAHCPWLDRRGGFLGFKFMIEGETHYGWARVAEIGTRSASIRGYAYETTPDQPILTGATSDPTNSSLTAPALPPAPQPATLGLLAQGTPALSLWRREEKEEGITE
jgi:hypothetical protein